MSTTHKKNTNDNQNWCQDGKSYRQLVMCCHISQKNVRASARRVSNDCVIAYNSLRIGDGGAFYKRQPNI